MYKSLFDIQVRFLKNTTLSEKTLNEIIFTLNWNIMFLQVYNLGKFNT